MIFSQEMDAQKYERTKNVIRATEKWNVLLFNAVGFYCCTVYQHPKKKKNLWSQPLPLTFSRVGIPI